MRSIVTSHLCGSVLLSLALPVVLLACAAGGVDDGTSQAAPLPGNLTLQRAASGARKCPTSLSGPINLPADDSVHPYSPYSDEWFYYSTHLETDDGLKFGFAQIVYTLLGPDSTPLEYVDATITDHAEGKYHFGGRQYAFGPATVLPGAFDFAIGSERVKGGNGHDVVHSEVVDGASRYVVDLTLESEKTPVLHLADGFVNYVSRERMSATGTISVNGVVHHVHGHTWFDHQFGPQLIELSTVQNWTWIAAQLENGSELLALVINKQDGTQQYIGSYTDEDCKTTQLGAKDFTVAATGSWSASPGCTYPMGWNVRVPSKGIAVHVSPVIRNQDILVPGQDRYYEGDSTVVGSVRGDAYVELFGFCAP